MVKTPGSFIPSTTWTLLQPVKDAINFQKMNNPQEVNRKLLGLVLCGGASALLQISKIKKGERKLKTVKREIGNKSGMAELKEEKQETDEQGREKKSIC